MQKRGIFHSLLFISIAVIAFLVLQFNVLSTHTITSITINTTNPAYLAPNVTKAGAQDFFNFTITPGTGQIINISITIPTTNFSTPLKININNNSWGWQSYALPSLGAATKIVFNSTNGSGISGSDQFIRLYINATAASITTEGLNNANWTITTGDRDGDTNSYSVYTSVDGKSPTVSLNIPASGSRFYTSRVILNYTANDTFLKSCELWFGYTNATYPTYVTNWHHNQTFSRVQSGVSSNFTLNLHRQNYTWNVQCNDTVNHQAFSTTNRTFILTPTSFTPLMSNETLSISNNCIDEGSRAGSTVIEELALIYLSNATLTVGSSMKVFVNWSGWHYGDPNYWAFFLDSSTTPAGTCATGYPTPPDGDALPTHYSMNCTVTIPFATTSGNHTIFVTVNDYGGYCLPTESNKDALGNTSTLSPFNVTPSMTLVITEPNGVNDTADTNFTIIWNATESDNRELTVSCYTDISNESYQLVYTCFESTTDDGNENCDTTFFSPGNYFVWCEANNGAGLTVRNYSSGPFGMANGSLTISHNTTWRMFGQDYAHTSFSTSLAPQKAHLVWNFSINTSIRSPPTIADDKVFFGADNGRIYALRISDGSLIWNYSTGSAVSAAVLVYNSTVFVGSGDTVYLLNENNGSLLDNHTFATSQLSSSAVVYSGKFFIGVGPSVAALSTDFISNLSKYWLASWQAGAISSSPAVGYNYVVVGSNNTKVYAFNRSSPVDTTAEQLWNYTTLGNITSSPAISVLHRRVFIGSDDKNVYSLNLTNSSVVWNYSTNGMVKSSPSIVLKRQYEGISNDTVIIGSDDWNVYAFNLHNGSVIWNYSTNGPVRSSPSIAGGMVFVGSDDNNTYAINLTTGTLVWNYTTNGNVRSSPAIANGIVVVASDDGNVYAFKKNPTVSLNAPSNNTFTSSTGAINFNFTVTGLNLDSCELWADWNGTWHSNQSTTPLTSGSIHSFSLIIPDGTWMWNVLCNDTKNNRVYSLNNFTITRDTTAPLINYTIATTTGLDLNISTLNITSLTVKLNISFGEDVSAGWYQISNFTQQTLCLNCRKNITNLTFPSFGSNTFRLWANDSSGNINSSTYNFTINQDTDGNGTIDEFDTDDDEDGIVDVNDTLKGNLSNVNTNIPSFSITINGSTNLRWPNITSSTQEVIFFNGTTMLAKFTFNFNTTTLNLGSVIVQKQTSADSAGYLLIKGIDLTSHGTTKDVYVNRLVPNSNYTSVCIRDLETSYITEISTNCNGANETYITCEGATTHVGSYTCNITGSVYNITGISHTAVKEFCTTNWSCGSWSSCSGSTQSKTCTDINGCNTTAGRPALTQSCSSGGGTTGGGGGGISGGRAANCTESWSCTAWGICENGKHNRTCTDINNCGTVTNKPYIEESCTEQPPITQPNATGIQKPLEKEPEEKGPTEEEKGRMIYLVIGIAAIVLLLGSAAVVIAIKLKKKEIPTKEDIKSLKEDMVKNIEKGITTNALPTYVSIAYAFFGLDEKEKQEVMPLISEANKLISNAKVALPDVINGLALKGIALEDIEALLTKMKWKQSELKAAVKEYSKKEAETKPSIAALLEGVRPKIMTKLKKVKPTIAELIEGKSGNKNKE